MKFLWMISKNFEPNLSKNVIRNQFFKHFVFQSIVIIILLSINKKMEHLSKYFIRTDVRFNLQMLFFSLENTVDMHEMSYVKKV